MTLRIARYKHTRHWALYDGAALVVVTVYRRGAQEVQRRLAAQPPAATSSLPQPVFRPGGGVSGSGWHGAVKAGARAFCAPPGA